VVDFRNTIIVMTSNIGSDHILGMAGDDANYDQMHDKVIQTLRKQFRPEFLNRIDELIIFHTLKREELRQIVSIQIKRIEKLLEAQKIQLQLTDAALDFVVNAGYDPVYGARPLKRAMQRELENPIATYLLEQTFGEGDTILIDCQENRLSFGKAAIAVEVKAEEVAEVVKVEEATANA
jgi:ATP-dependent Clp protease ATP-binding subunit ClpB